MCVRVCILFLILTPFLDKNLEKLGDWTGLHFNCFLKLPSVLRLSNSSKQREIIAKPLIYFSPVSFKGGKKSTSLRCYLEFPSALYHKTEACLK